MSPPLHLLPSQSFQCHSCGRCCRNSWDIRVEPSARRDILASHAADAVTRSGFTPLIVLSDGSEAANRRQDGACVFLDTGELCSLHAELGGARKPLACQLYPYSVTATPDGFFASLSFACPSVVAGQGGDLEANRMELSDLLRERGSAADAPQQVEVLAGRSISWTSYRKLEDRLRQAFLPAQPVRSLLDAAVSIVKTLKQSGDPAWPDLAQSRGEELFEESMLAMFSASVIALWELPSNPEGRQAFSQAVLAGEPLHSTRHGMPLPNFDFFPVDSALTEEIFGRYFENAIFGKSLLTGPVLDRLLALACGYTLAGYYEAAFRQQAGAEQANPETISRAFELVEADLLSHTRSADPLFAAFAATLCQAHIEETE